MYAMNLRAAIVAGIAKMAESGGDTVRATNAQRCIPCAHILMTQRYRLRHVT